MPDEHSVGRLLAWAYPDRIAQHQAPGVYRLVSGRRARLDPADRLAEAPYLVVARLDGGATEARIHLAAPVSLAVLREVAGRGSSRTRRSASSRCWAPWWRGAGSVWDRW